MIRSQLVLHLVTDKKNIDDLDPREVARKIVPDLAKQDTLNETVFSQLSDDDLKDTWVITTNIISELRKAVKNKATLHRMINAAKRKKTAKGKKQITKGAKKSHQNQEAAAANQGNE